MEENKNNPGVLNPAHVLAKRLQENRKSLHIARIPDKTREAFIKIAEEEFCNDYGMTLKFIMDDIPSQDIRMVIAQIEELESRIEKLESPSNNAEEISNESKVKMLNGNVIRGVKKNG